MCLIIHQPKGHTLSHAQLRDIFARNGDGFGVMRAHRGTLHTLRAVPATAAEMIALYSEHAAGRECVLHWRVATHGAVDVANAHPFTLTPDVAIMHNGVLDCGTPSRAMSDTWHMAHHVLAPIARDNVDALFSPEMHAVMSPLIRGSKIAIAHADGRVAIWNRAEGVEHGGLWYSNAYGWNAPAHLTRYAVRAWHDDVCSGTAPRATVHTLDTLGASDTLDALGYLDDEHPEFRALQTACDLHAELGALRWAESHPDAAAHLIAAWVGVSLDEAGDVLDTEPMTAADWLYEMAT